MSVFIIAEAGVNHNGDRDLAFQLIEEAAKAGADAVKFQTFKANTLVSLNAPKARYQLKSTDPNISQLEMLRQLELQWAWHKDLSVFARKLGISFMSSAFDPESLKFLIAEVGIDIIKIPSGELTNGPLLLVTAKSGLPVILSTGMSTIEEIKAALGVLAFGYCGKTNPGIDEFAAAFLSNEGKRLLQERVNLLHCTTDYPASLEDINLNAMNNLSEHFALPVGLSDHSSGIVVPIAASALGVTIIEKHFTLSRKLPGPDHSASLVPAELKEMIESIRIVEKAMGNGIKKPTKSELSNISAVRKSLHALESIAEGELFSEMNIGARRPGNGLSPMQYWDLIGTPSPRAYQSGEPIKL